MVWCRWLTILSLIFLSCKHKSDAVSSEKWWEQTNPFLERGHEELIALAVLYANRELPESVKFDPIPFDEGAFELKSTMLTGNFAMDFPNRVTERIANNEKDLVAYFLPNLDPRPNDEQWQQYPTLQRLHFLRSPDHSRAPEQWREACKDGVGTITELSWKALQMRIKGLYQDDSFEYRDLFSFWLGASLHVIQDRFGPAHVKAMANDDRSIRDICSVYRTDSGSGICYHGLIDFDDSVWGPVPIPTDENPDERIKSLRPEAQTAVKVSARYLVIMGELRALAETMKAGGKSEAEILQAVQSKLETDLKRFYEDKQKVDEGYFRCGS